MYRLKFKASKLKVKMAQDGKEGLKMAQHYKPDLLLLDIRIPKLGGEEVLHHLQSTHDWAQQMKVIIFSNVNRDVAPKELHSLKIDKYLVKAHYTPGQIIEIIREILGINHSLYA